MKPILPTIIGCTLLFSASTQAKELNIIAPKIPPQFDETGNGRVGDLIRATLEKCGHTVKFTIVPFGRHWNDYTEGTKYDGMATAPGDSTFPGFPTEPFLNLNDGATVINGKGLDHIKSVDDLAGKNIVTFVGAAKVLGIEKAASAFKSKSERADQIDHARRLLAGRDDAIIADGLITAYYLEQVREEEKAKPGGVIDAALPTTFRGIFPPSKQRLFFRDQAVATDFNRCFGELKQSGEAQKITKPYIDKYKATLGDQYPDLAQ